jgi:hypothetical protein
MHKFAIYLSVLLGIWMIVRQARPEAADGTEHKTDKKCEQFLRVLAAEMTDADATKAGFRTVGTSVTHLGATVVDACGERLTVQFGEFSSPEDAKRYFDWNVSRASKILVQGDKTDSKGKKVGYRAEIVPQDQKGSAVVWTSGPVFRIIFGTSLKDALELEKRYSD